MDLKILWDAHVTHYRQSLHCSGCFESSSYISFSSGLSGQLLGTQPVHSNSPLSILASNQF